MYKTYLNQVKQRERGSFFDYTSIHGLRYIFGKGKRYCIIWSILFVLSFAITVWSGVSSISRYLCYEVSTNMVYDKVEEIEFPAITICNMNVLDGKKIGSNDLMLDIASSLLFGDKLTSNAINEQNKKTCLHASQEHIGLVELMNMLNNDAFKGDLQGTMYELFMPSSKTNVLKCCWNSKVIPCEGLFYNHFDINGVCFTFNLKNEFVVGAKDFLGVYGYGLNSTNYQYRTITNAGPNSGLQLLLNTEQLNYCGIITKYQGAGFRAYIHDPLRLSSYYQDRSIFLSPGYRTEIIIKPKSFRRKTAHLNKCTNFRDIPLSPVESVYSRWSCIYQCAGIYVYNTCKCFITYGDKVMQRYSKIFNKKMNQSDICAGKSARLECSFRALLYALKWSNILCDDCMMPCYETMYDFQMTSIMFPDVLNLTEKTFMQKNDLLVNFRYESMTILYINEVQDFTARDLFIYFGGMLGLFLGMSVISPAEIFYEFFISAVRLLFKIHLVDMVKKVHKGMKSHVNLILNLILNCSKLVKKNVKTRRASRVIVLKQKSSKDINCHQAKRTVFIRIEAHPN